MTQPNPFAPPAAPAEPAGQHSPNPFGQPAAAPVQAYAPPAPSAAPPWMATPTQAEIGQAYAPPATTYGTGPVAQTVAHAAPYAPPALGVGALGAAAPPPPSGGIGADLAAMYGRLVLAIPTHLEVVPRAEKYITTEQRAAGNTTQERMTVTIIVLDDGHGGQQPIAWGGAPHELPPKAHTNSDPLPYVRKAMWIRQSRLISQFREYLPANRGGEQGMAVGRPVKTGPAHNDPWYLTTGTEQEMVIARYYLEAVGRGQFPHPLAP